jgi:hypothetical protein
MPRYYFSVANDRCFDDTDGLSCPIQQASGFARDLMRNEPA